MNLRFWQRRAPSNECPHTLWTNWSEPEPAILKKMTNFGVVLEERACMGQGRRCLSCNLEERRAIGVVRA